MSIKRFFFAGIVISILFLFFDFAWHQLFFKAFYHAQEQAIMRQKVQYLSLGLGAIYRGFLFTFVYLVFVKKPQSLIRGLLFGLCIGLLLISVNSTHFAMMNISSIQWLWYESANLLIQSVIAGILIPIFAMGDNKHRGEQPA
jgi:hypothetical protein